MGEVNSLATSAYDDWDYQRDRDLIEDAEFGIIEDLGSGDGITSVNAAEVDKSWQAFGFVLTVYSLISLVIVDIYPLANSALSYTPNFSDFIGITTLLVGILTIVLVIGQLKLAERQTSILERQDAWMQRTEDLVLGLGNGPEKWTKLEEICEATSDDEIRTMSIPISIRNDGKVTRGVHVSFWLKHFKDEAVPRLTIVGDDWIVEKESIQDVVGNVVRTDVKYTKHFGDVLIPGDGRVATIGRLSMTYVTRDREYDILYQLMSESGVFPSEPANIDVNVLRLTR